MQNNDSDYDDNISNNKIDRSEEKYGYSATWIDQNACLKTSASLYVFEGVLRE